ncbi:MAG: cobyrinate a,c-diamide synthase [Nitrospirae bacterium]|nr:cobyrinate a,c-diamide synthase [Nitrospirota bacterium]
MHGIVIAGTHSGCGKTIITLGILAALKKRGYKVQAYKAGPDFIDSGLHKLITKNPSRNLDLWMCGEDYVRNCFYTFSINADISVVEGVMGLYDGDYSTAKLAALLNLPVVIVVDAYGMAESAGALVKGFVEYQNIKVSKYQSVNDSDTLTLCNSDTCVAGVIFNRVASENHFKRLKDSVQDVPVLGYLPRELDFEIPHRHLGLTVAEENPISDEKIQRLADAVLQHIDVDLIVQKCRSAEVQNANNSPISPRNLRGGYRGTGPQTHNSKIRIAVAYDKAFCFYYEDNMDLLIDNGAEIIPFSPLTDKKIPDNVKTIYIGGGYPELYAHALSSNELMLNAIHDWCMSGKPLYAECGGLMYLSRGIYDFEGNFHRMAQVFPFTTVMKKDNVNLGYREIVLNEDCILGKKGDKAKGHEFHYSEIKHQDVKVSKCQSVKDSDTLILGHSDTQIYSIHNNVGETLYDEGYRIRNTLTSYIHIHFGSNLNIAGNFIKSVKET